MGIALRERQEQGTCIKGVTKSLWLAGIRPKAKEHWGFGGRNGIPQEADFACVM